MRQLPIFVPGAALPAPDRDDPETTLQGMRQRLGRLHPPAKPGLLRRLRAFTRKWCHDHLPRLSRGEILTFEEWIENVNMPLWRKRQLELASEELFAGEDPSPRQLRCKTFTKSEQYLEPKFARMINSRSDAYKAWAGPRIASVERVLFAEDGIDGTDVAFIKKTAVAERPGRIRDALCSPGATYFVTDFSGFEGSESVELLRATEAQLLSWVLGEADPGFVRAYKRILCGTNKGRARVAKFSTRGCRMSGDQDTSLGNGFLNMIVLSFLAAEKGSHVKGFFEGDDGLTVITPEAPTAADYADLGLSIKLERFRSFGEASFCGILADEQDLDLVRDIAPTIVKFGTTLSPQMHGGLSVLRGLQLAKALSLLAEHPNCPILGPLAHRTAVLLKGERPRFSETWWERQAASRAASLRRSLPRPDIKPRTRELVSRLYGISPELQLAVEAQIASMKLGPLPDLVVELVHAHPLAKSWFDFAITHRHLEPLGQPLRPDPPL